jgi:ubiquinone/menaquinone biosynthesis C-methylase UbiE
LAIDLGTGTGTAALALARHGWSVQGIDISSPLLERARSKAALQNLEVDWRQADYALLSNETGSVDAAVSSLGIVFSFNHTAIVQEVHRVLRPQGIFIFAALSEHGTARDIHDAMSPYLPVPSGETPNPFDWGNADYVRALLEGNFDSIRTSTITLNWSYATPTEAANKLFAVSPLHRAAEEIQNNSSSGIRDAVVKVLPPHGSKVDFAITFARAL